MVILKSMLVILMVDSGNGFEDIELVVETCFFSSYCLADGTKCAREEPIDAMECPGVAETSCLPTMHRYR